MSSIAYLSKGFRGEPAVFTSSVQGYRQTDIGEDHPLGRRPNWWEALRLARRCSRYLDKKRAVLEEVRR